MTSVNETVSRLCAIWSELLGLDSVGPDDDFLDLGGDSFLAIRMLGTIRTEFGRSLEMPDFFENPSIRALAKLIDGEEMESKFNRLVPVRFDRERPPTHTFDGTFVFAFSTTQLMERLQLRFPVFTVSIDLTFGRLDFSEDIHELAERHVEELLVADPDGPYRLAGFSLGGFIAHEMACHLRRKGRRVEFLVLLDPLLLSLDDRPVLAANGARSGAESVQNVLGKEKRRGSSWSRFLKVPILQKASWIWRRRSGFRRYTLRMTARVLRALYTNGLWPWPTVPVILRKEWALLCKEAIWRGYRPEPFDGDMIVFAGRSRVEEAKVYWPPLVNGKLDCRPLPADDHHDVLFVPESLDLIRACFDELLGAGQVDSADEASELV